MDQLADLLIVKPGQHGHLVRGQWRQVRRHDVLGHLLLVPRTGNYAGHCRTIENPSKGEVSHAHSFGKDPDFLNGLKCRLEIHTRKGFPAIKSFAITIEFPMIILGKGSGPIDFPAQQTARERKSGPGCRCHVAGPAGKTDPSLAAGKY